MASEPNAAVKDSPGGSFTRLARILALAEHHLGDRRRATDWLDQPDHALGGIAPRQAIDTNVGTAQVENILGRIGYGGIS